MVQIVVYLLVLPHGPIVAPIIKGQKKKETVFFYSSHNLPQISILPTTKICLGFQALHSILSVHIQGQFFFYSKVTLYSSQVAESLATQEISFLAEEYPIVTAILFLPFRK